MRTWLRTVIGSLGVATTLALGAAPGAAEADGVRAPAPRVFPAYRDPWRTGRAPAPSVFPVYPDPWRNYGRSHPGFRNPRPGVAPQPVWVQPYWAWSGYRWVWVPGYWGY